MFGLFVDELAMTVCTTRHWRTSGRLVQELNVCTVGTHFAAEVIWNRLSCPMADQSAKAENWTSNLLITSPTTHQLSYFVPRGIRDKDITLDSNEFKIWITYLELVIVEIYEIV